MAFLVRTTTNAWVGWGWGWGVTQRDGIYRTKRHHRGLDAPEAPRPPFALHGTDALPLDLVVPHITVGSRVASRCQSRMAGPLYQKAYIAVHCIQLQEIGWN